jgi:ABC-type amino acid transport substrate-binding protein
MTLVITGLFLNPMAYAQRFHSDIQRVIQSNQLVFALTAEDYPPLFSATADGYLTGIGIALMEDIAEEMGVSPKFSRKARSFNEVIEQVASGEADIGFFTSLTLSRAKQVLFTQPYLTSHMAFIVNHLRLMREGVKTGLKDLKEIMGTHQKIGLLEGSAYLEPVKGIFPYAELVFYHSIADLRQAAKNGDILAAVRNDLTAKSYLVRNPSAAIKVDVFVDENYTDYIAFAVRPDSPLLLSWLNSYILIKDLKMNSEEFIKRFIRRQEDPQHYLKQRYRLKP